MSKLIGANLLRMKKDRAFLLCTLAVFVICALCMVDGCRLAIKNGETELVLDEIIYNFAPAIGIFTAVFASMFIGADYSDGTIRNKLIVGHKRTDVYGSNLISCCLASLVFDAVLLLGGLVGIPVFGGLKMGFAELAALLGAMALSSIAVSALMTAIAMNCSNKAVAAIISLLLFLALLLWASSIYNALSEPEMTAGIVITENGMNMGEPTPNPYYIGGTLRAVYEMLLDILPTGQKIQIANVALAHPLRGMAFSAVLTVVFSLVGLVIFKKKNIK